MPRVSTLECKGIKVAINVSAKGEFYANLPDYLKEAFSETEVSRADGCFKVTAHTMDGLTTKIRHGIYAYYEPVVTEEPVIQYCIDGKATFGLDSEGNIHPNAVPEGVEWDGMDSRYGGLHATNRNYGGFGLTIGAVARLKKTKHYPDGHTAVEYDRYNGPEGQSHLHDPSDPKASPAIKLNAWTGFTLPNDNRMNKPMFDDKKTKEIPYTDEAAEFFHNMMFAMATLVKQVQDYTFDPDMLEQTIENSTKTGRLPFAGNSDQS